MASKVDIFNMALSNIGVSERVSTDSERSKAAQTCESNWDQAVRTMLADYPWPFATKFATLAETVEAPPKRWSFQYVYPTDCVRALYMTVAGYRDVPESMRPRFEIGMGSGTGQVIITNEENAELAYVAMIDNAGLFPPLVAQALGWKLAELIAMPMTATQGMLQTASQGYEMAFQKAAAMAMNEGQGDYNRDSEFITVRGA